MSDVAAKRTLSCFDSTMLAVGTMIGSGVLLVPASMARATTPSLALLAWLVAALFSLFGALTLAELGAAWPRSGGLFVYLQEAFGGFAGASYGWALFLIIQTGSIAAVALAAAVALSAFVAVDVRLLALLIIALLTAVNIAGAQLGTRTQNLFTCVKVLLFFGLIALALTSSDASLAHFFADKPVSFFGWAAVLTGPLFAFDGWIHTSYVAGEIADPQRNLPRAAVYAMAVVSLVYLLLAGALYYGVADVSATPLVTDALAVGRGDHWRWFFSALTLTTLLGAVSAMIFAGARVYFAMAQERRFPALAGRLHSRLGTPSNALALQGAWAAALVFVGGFEQLLDYVVFVSWLYYGLGGVAVFVLRAKQPAVYRPYRVPTWMAVTFIAGSAGVVVFTFLASIR